MVIFPALVTLADGTTRDTCQVWAGPYGTKVYAWNRRGRKAELVAESTHQPIRQNGKRGKFLGHVELAGTDLMDPDRPRLSIVEQAGCGCGHPMKLWQPPRDVRMRA